MQGMKRCADRLKKGKRIMEYRKVMIQQCVDGETMDTEILLPCFAQEEEDTGVGIWGYRHMQYMKEHNKVLYGSLLANGTLNCYLADIDRQAEQIIDAAVSALAQADGTDESLKSRDMMKWVGLMNNYRHCAEEIVYADVIYR